MLFFFFQAEDGIRDWSVTGVQTCALPIWSLITLPRQAPLHLPFGGEGWPKAGVRRRTSEEAKSWQRSWIERNTGLRLPRERSEERRVGKECRSRWWRDH